MNTLLANFYISRSFKCSSFNWFVILFGQFGWLWEVLEIQEIQDSGYRMAAVWKS